MQRHDPLQARHCSPADRRTLVLLGFWMRSAFVGAACAAAGVASMIHPQGASSVTALILIGVGIGFACLAWQRTAALLDRIDTNTSIQSRGDGASSPRPVVRASVSS